MPTFLENKFYSDAEGICYYHCCVHPRYRKGMGHSGSGLAEFITRYRAIVFKPFKGEVVDGVVNNVNKMGFFADVGPLTVFVSHQELTMFPLVYLDMKFDASSNPPSFIPDGQVSIPNNYHLSTFIRIYLINFSSQFAIGTIKEDHLV
ncbi:hypothetical protein BJ165DRAFT_1416534 [Panaeolus papilionaceus]|nr:hypothetical protein BJ165DRAFT_1416534 [Panaeolus papilionaceus]